MKKLIKVIAVVAIILLLCSAVLYLRIQSFATPTKGDKISTYDYPKGALVVIDIQEDFTGKSAKKPFPYKDSEVFISKVNGIIDSAVKQQIPVLYVRQVFSNNIMDFPLSKGRVIEGKQGAQVDSNVKLINSKIFAKKKSDSFSNKEFERYLIENKVDHLYLVGLDAAACIYKTALGAINRNYKVNVIQDGIKTMNMDKLDDILKDYKQHGIVLMRSSAFADLK